MTDTPQLKLFNSLTRQLETFEPIHAGEARVYTCGPTVYNYPHIGNMRAYVFADVLGRTLRFRGYDLTHIINITDVGHLTDDADAGEDKLEKMAAQQKQSIWDIAAHYTAAFKADVKALNIREPAQWSVATDYIEEMIDFAKAIEGKHCYQLESGLYFDVSTVEDYGRLARAQTEEGESRIGDVEGKRNAADFAIWRTTPEGETRQMEWDSPWGRGAPGWHLECSVMGGKLLGFPFDIHTGGIDHREIHHPNEIAQNQAFCGCGGLDEATHSGARIWMHNNFLVERSGKMSKSSGEFLRLQLLIDKGYHPLAYRMMCLQAHYRSELEFSWEGLGAALTRLARLVLALEKLRSRAPERVEVKYNRQFSAIRAEFEAAICDDLNTSDALVILERLLALKTGERAQQLALIQEFDEVLGLNLRNIRRVDLRIRPRDVDITEAEVERLIEERARARADKDYAKSDEIREQLLAKRVHLMDGGASEMRYDWVLETDLA